MPSLMSYFPPETGTAFEYRDLQIWLATLEGEVARLREVLEAIGGQSTSKPFNVTGSSITMTSPGPANLTASMVQMSAGTMNFNASMAMFSGVIQCQTIIANSVVGASYTPGAGNVW